MACQSWRCSLDRLALLVVAYVRFDGTWEWRTARTEQLQNRRWAGGRHLILGTGGCHLLRRVLVYIAPHIRIRVVCSLRYMYPEHMRGCCAHPSRGRHHVPIVLPTAPPWHSRKQTFDGLPGLGPCSSPSSISLSWSVPLGGTISRRGDHRVDSVSTWKSALLNSANDP